MSKLLLTVGDVEQYMDSIAPFETAEAFDNVGILVGKRSNVVRCILVCLDVTWSVVQEAKKLGADLIISHHPLMFHARKRLVEEDPEAHILCELIRNNINVISAHTNLDATLHSGSACLARALGMKEIAQDGYLFYGELPEAREVQQLQQDLEKHLHVAVRIYGNTQQNIRALAIAGGAYDEGYVRAKELGVQALVTGEVRHHNAISAAMENMVLFDGTHFATEEILVPHLAASLQNALSALKYDVSVYPSSVALFAGGVD